MTLRWKKKSCGCVRTKLIVDDERILIRCPRHRGKPSKKGYSLAYFDDDGIVRRA